MRERQLTGQWQKAAERQHMWRPRRKRSVGLIEREWDHKTSRVQQRKQPPCDTALLIWACCLERASLRSVWELTQLSQCIMGDQREASVLGHRAGTHSSQRSKWRRTRERKEGWRRNRRWKRKQSCWTGFSITACHLLWHLNCSAA